MKILYALLALTLVACGGSSADSAASAPTGSVPSNPATPTPAPPGVVFGSVATLNLVNDASATIGARTMSFGQVFRPGQVRPDNTVSMTINGSTTPAQLDAKALNIDGSVRHAVVTVSLPSMRAGESLNATLVNAASQAKPPSPRYIDTPAMLLTVSMYGTNGSILTKVIDLKTVAQAAGAATPWLQGQLGYERRYTADIDGDLQATFDVFTPVSGPARVDLVMHNDWTGVRRSANRTYDVEVRLDGAIVYQARSIKHYPFSTWHKLFWTDGAPDVRMKPNLELLEAVAAVPRYDRNFTVAASVLNGVESASAQTQRPLSPGSVTMYMPNTGSRPDIGPLPTWAVVDLLVGTANTRRTLLMNADAAGSIPWHLRERSSGLPLTVDDHPNLWLDPRGGDTVNGVLPEAFQFASDGWEIDDAHQPSLSYLPYLVTGRQYYRDELAQHAAFNLLFYDSDYRGGRQALAMGTDGQGWYQIRGMAWFFRTLAGAAYILPSDHPLKSYFDEKLRGNLAKYVELYVEQRRLKDAGPLEGWVPGDMDTKDLIAPWMQAFLATSLAWTNDMGYSDAGRMLNWMSNFLAGLYTSGAAGLDPAVAVAYELPVRNHSQNRLYNTWREVYQTSEVPSLSAARIQETFNDYAMIMRAALAGAYNVTPSAKNTAAYNYLSSSLARVTNPAIRGDPTYAILPATEPAR